MNIDSELSIVVSFVGFSWIFAKKIFPFITRKLDAHIESVKNKISEVELVKEAASLSLKRAYVKKGTVEEIIKENIRKSEEKIRKLRQEHEEHIKLLYERYESSLKTRLEDELTKHKNQLIERLSDFVLEKLSERVNRTDCKVITNITKEDLKKLI